eukprot:scaffold10726_cov182-Alexandrium_tamarense.AAC.3
MSQTSNTKPKGAKRKTQACTECHKSKSKCTYPDPTTTAAGGTAKLCCNRCIRLGRDCIPHISQQGKRNKKTEEETMKNEKRVNEDDMQDGLCKSTMCAAAFGNQDKILKENNLSLELPRHITNSMAGQFPAGGGGGMMGGQFAGRSGAGILHPADILSGGMNSSQLSLMLNHFSGTSGGKSDTMSTLNNIMSSSAMGATGPPPSVDALLMLASRSTSIGSNSGVNLGGTASAAPALPGTSQHLIQQWQHQQNQLRYAVMGGMQTATMMGMTQASGDGSATGNQLDTAAAADNTADTQESQLRRSSYNAQFVTPEDAIGNHITGQKLPCLQNHYGLQCQIREWISMALVRRSFALLSKASSLANRCGISMDRILCGVVEEVEKKGGAEKKTKGGCKMNVGGKMNYLLSVFLEPRTAQVVPMEQREMLVPTLPPSLLSLVGCQACPTFKCRDVGNRWIVIRETNCGVTRFYASPAFERNLLCWRHISQIFEDNLADGFSLMFAKEDFRRFLACYAHQISSQPSAESPIRPVYAPKITVRLLSRDWGQTEAVTEEMIEGVGKNEAETTEMDALFVVVPTMDKVTYYLELFHPNLESDAKDCEADDNDEGTETPESNPPALDTVMEGEDWQGIDEILASGDDMDALMKALLD